MGQSPAGEDCNRNGIGLPLLNGPTEFGPRHPYPTQFTADGRKQARPGDLLFCVRGSTTGRMNWADQKYAIGRGIAGIRHKTNPRLQPLIRAAVEYQLPVLLQGATGSTFPNVSGPQLAAIPFPDLETKQAEAIADTLGALDDKIELNRKMNATLEAMARALFRDWFVDFGPTRAKMEGRAPYLSPDLWSLFPDCLDDEGMPEGWKVSPLDALAEVTMGISPDGSTYNDDGQGTPLCNGPVEYGDFFLRQIKWTTAPSKLAQRGDLIICVRGSTTGRHAFADTEYCLGRGVASIRGRDEGQEFVETALLSQMDRLLQKTTGSVFPSLSTQDIKSFGLIDPGSSLRKTFCHAVRPMRKKVWANVEESRTLAQTRDLLLPRLMSGELRVADLALTERETAA